MPRKYRLTNKKLIERCAKSGRKFYTKFLIIKKLDALDKRFAIVVSKKFDKSAVKRNYIRRQIRAILIKNLDKFSNGYYLIVVKSDINKYEYIELEKDIQNFS